MDYQPYYMVTDPAQLFTPATSEVHLSTIEYCIREDAIASAKRACRFVFVFPEIANDTLDAWGLTEQLKTYAQQHYYSIQVSRMYNLHVGGGLRLRQREYQIGPPQEQCYFRAELRFFTKEYFDAYTAKGIPPWEVLYVNHLGVLSVGNPGHYTADTRAFLGSGLRINPACKSDQRPSKIILFDTAGEQYYPVDKQS